MLKNKEISPDKYENLLKKYGIYKKMSNTLKIQEKKIPKKILVRKAIHKI